jgi:hypothetical protein
MSIREALHKKPVQRRTMLQEFSGETMTSTQKKSRTSKAKTKKSITRLECRKHSTDIFMPLLNSKAEHNAPMYI